MLGLFMILAGVTLTLGSLLAGYYVISSRCSLEGAPGCDAGVIELISGLMIADEGIFFWLAWVVGVFLIWGGMRMRCN